MLSPVGSVKVTGPDGDGGSALFATDSLFRNALESSPDCIQIVDLSGDIRFVNRSGRVMLGLTEASSLVGVAWLNLWADADQGAARAALRAAAGGELRWFTAQTASGAARHFDNIVSPLRDDNAKAVALLVTSRDVTELEHARLAAAERERRAALQAAVQRSAARMVKLGGWQVNLCTETVLLTDETIRLFGGAGSPEAPLEEHLRAVYDSHEIPRIKALLEGARLRGESFSYDARYEARDGSVGWLRSLGEPVYENGVCVAIRGAVLDITEEKTAQATIERAEQRLLMALQLAGVRVYDLDLEQRNLTRYGSATALDGPEPTFEDFWPPASERVIHALDIERVRAEWALAEATDTLFRSEFRVHRMDGQERWSFCVSKLMRDTSGRPLRLLLAAMDITERKRNELENLQTMAKMREHEARQKLLLGELNHRVKNTLASVQSVAVQTLTDARDVSEGRELFVERLLALSGTHNLLVKHEWQSASFRELVETTLKPYGRAYEYGGPDLQLGPNFAVSLGMALHELATNALKHGAWTTQGRVRIQVTGTCAEACIVWRESDGPPVSAPSRSGFGSRLLERGVAAELGGRVTLDFADGGLVCTITVPLSARLQVLGQEQA